MIIDNYCYTCDSSRCPHVLDRLGILVHREDDDDGGIKVYRNDRRGILTIRVGYDSGVCTREFEAPIDAFESEY